MPRRIRRLASKRSRASERNNESTKELQFAFWFRRLVFVLTGVLVVIRALSYSGYEAMTTELLLAVSNPSTGSSSSSSNTGGEMSSSVQGGDNVNTNQQDSLSLSSPLTTTTSTSSTPVTGSLRGDVATRYAMEPEWLWTYLLQKGPQSADWSVMEVGMHRAVQCLQGANLGYTSHCVEPSPANFERVKLGVRRAASDVQARVHLYNVAAGSEDTTVEFVSSGGTGDHVGTMDMWSMTDMKDEGFKGGSKTGSIVQVPSKRLDDLLGDKITGKVWVAKIDTQGFEPNVFSGLDGLLSSHRISMIMTEYWPKGIDMIAGKPKSCIAVEQVLGKLFKYGYTVYAMPVVSHPASKIWKQLKTLQHSRPLDDLMKNCQWYYELEEMHPQDDYKMGYWSDIFAVAPGVEVPAGILSNQPLMNPYP